MKLFLTLLISHPVTSSYKTSLHPRALTREHSPDPPGQPDLRLNRRSHVDNHPPTTMPSSWFSEKIAPGGSTEDGSDPAEAQALQDYLDDKLDASAAAAAITRPVEDARDPGADLPRLWGLLCDALTELPPPAIPALIQLLAAIQHLPAAAPGDKPTPPHGPLWGGLPGFGHHWADAHKRDDWRSALARESRERDRAELRAQHVRGAEVEARMVVARVAGIPLDWGLDCVCDALERETPVLDFEVPAAAAWVGVAGGLVRGAAVDGMHSWALGRRRDLWPAGDDRMNLQRYRFWERRFGELAERSRVTRDVAERAVVAMGRDDAR